MTLEKMNVFTNDDALQLSKLHLSNEISYRLRGRGKSSGRASKGEEKSGNLHLGGFSLAIVVTTTAHDRYRDPSASTCGAREI
jgi:hypothetical protein